MEDSFCEDCALSSVLGWFGVVAFSPSEKRSLSEVWQLPGADFGDVSKVETISNSFSGVDDPGKEHGVPFSQVRMQSNKRSLSLFSSSVEFFRLPGAAGWQPTSWVIFFIWLLLKNAIESSGEKRLVRDEVASKLRLKLGRTFFC